MFADNTKTDSITLAPGAARAIQELISERKLDGYALRVYVSGRSCSGFQYGMALEANIREQDHVSECEGVKVVVDEISFPYLVGSTIDYIDDPDGGGFKIVNPNDASSCDSGCCSSGSCC